MPKTDPDGFAVGSADQLLPFHVSARVVNPDTPFSQPPTAVQDVSVAQETSSKKLWTLPAGLGVLCSVHVDPLKRYASGNWFWGLFVHQPTAVQRFGDGVQETSWRALW